MQKVSIEKSQQLIKLWTEVRNTYENATRLVLSAKERNREALTEVILCGNALNKAKALIGHGKWLKELKKNAKGVSMRTAQRWMELAKTSHVTDLKKAKSIRQAYILAGIIEEEDIEPQQMRPLLVVQPDQGIEHAPVPQTHTRNGKTKLASWEKKPLDPRPIIKTTVKELLALIKPLPAADARALLKPLRPWLKARRA